MDIIIKSLSKGVLFMFMFMFMMSRIHGSISLCDRAPYPDLCHQLLRSNTSDQTLTVSLLVDQTQFAFRDVALRATLERAEKAHNLVSFMDVSSFDVQAKSAWLDCMELYEDTVDQLRRSINSSTDSLGAQTWLSAAVTNQQTCMNGFDDFQLSSNHLPLVLTEVSKFISNSLFINKAVSVESTTSTMNLGRRLLSDRGFPTWVSTADRRLLQSSKAASSADIVVAQDGSGNYKTIAEAVAAAGKRSGTGRFVIHVKAGTYRENIEIKKTMKNLMFIGDGKDVTVVTGSKNVQDGTTTFKSATFAVSGPGFIARDMTFENTAGPQKHQAVALRCGSDLSIFYSCSFKGYQDTLYVYSQRQFYRNCDIYGTVDFIFGDAAAVIQNSNIYVRKPMSGQKNTITAQGRSDPNENTGIVIHNSQIASAGDLGSVKTYLGRPWKQYSRTVIMKSSISGIVDPAGWLEWSGNFALNTLYYGEYLNSGPGAGTTGRVKWGGYHVITSASEAAKFTVGNFLAGGSWIPATGFPFTSGL